ncbi:blastula protease 10-like isoform X2 [Pecten maximus]|uniref:blastula protease 10-like isoform X2 n=1 Tax=Pecten maximus TaxID=6579 RepID=UPI0014583D0A|nr:blastula protease 10-like isoform X2 [Pecten maximus]
MVICTPEHFSVGLVFILVFIPQGQVQTSEIPKENDNASPIDRSRMSAMDLIVYANTGHDSHHLIEGDIVPSRKRNAVQIDAWKWNGHQIPYTIDVNGFSMYGLKVIREAIDQFNRDVSCIKYVPRSKEQDYVRIVHGYGCHSSIGRDGGRQDVTLGDNCYYTGVVVHELTHAVGFFHEQSRYDRDKYVEVRWENIVDGKDRDFIAESRNILNTLGAPYDYGSVMHYGATTFSKNGNPTLKALFDDKGTMGQRNGFSAVDIWKINKLYGCNTENAPKPLWMLQDTTTIAKPTTERPTTTDKATTDATPTTTQNSPTTATSSVSLTTRIIAAIISSSATPTAAQIKPLTPGLSGPPSTFDVVVFQNSLRIYWTKPCTEHAVTAFILTYWQAAGRRIKVKIDPTKLTYYISTLYHPGRKLHVTIATQTAAGEGPTSDVISTYSACGYEISLKENGTFDKIHSPYFSQGYYEPDVACRWTINVPIGQRLKVEFLSLDLITNDRCDGDFVTINDVMFCNTVPNNGYILSDDSTNQITFYSQAGPSKKQGGFKIFVSVDGKRPRNVTTVSLPGIIQLFWETPEGKQGKPYGYDLKYRLIPEHHVSEIRLDSHRNHFPITTGTHYGREYEINVATIDIINGIETKGADYKTNIRAACGRNITVNRPGILRSPHFPEQYEPDTICEWNLVIEDGYELTLTFNELALQTTPGCILDYVDITGIGKHCTMSDLYNAPLVTRSKVTKVRFVSDEETELKGFELQYARILIPHR